VIELVWWSLKRAKKGEYPEYYNTETNTATFPTALSENDPPYKQMRDKEPKNCSTSTSIRCCSCQENVNDGEGIVRCKCQRARRENISCTNLLTDLKGESL
jgi:hypothetical protein